jgi:hypothetical protein
MPTGGGSAQMNTTVNAHNAKQATIGLFDDIHG